MAFTLEEFRNTFWTVTTGDLYVSPLGSNVTGDGSPSNPYKTINYSIQNRTTDQNNIIVGSGEYNESIDGGGNSISLIGDGVVIFDGNDLTTSGIYNLDNSTSILKNIIFQNHSISVDTGLSIILGCTFRNGSTNLGGDIRNCIFESVGINVSTSSMIRNCSFFGSQVIGGVNITEIKNSLLDATSELQIESSSTQIFDYCNQENGAKVSIDGTEYTSLNAVKGASTYQNNGTGIATGLTTTDLQKRDYSLPRSSVLLTSGEFGQQIGALKRVFNSRRQGIVIVNHEEFEFVDNDNAIQLKDNVERGIVSVAFQLDNSIIKLGQANLLGLHLFESIPSSVFKEEERFNSVNQSYLTYELRYHNNNPLRLSEEAYKTFLWGTVPQIDSEGRGNGEIDFDRSTARGIVTRFIQLRITVHASQSFLVQEDLDCLLQENGDKIIWKIN